MNSSAERRRTGGLTALTVIKKTKRRTTEKILQAFGKSEETQDDQDYEQLNSEFNDTHKQLVVLLSKLQLYAEAFEKWEKCGDALAKEISTFVQSGKDTGCESRAKLEKIDECFQSTQQELGALVSNMVDCWSSQVLNPLRDVAFNFDTKVKDKVHQRVVDKVDFDIYRRRAKKCAGNAKMNQAQKNFAKLAITQDRFEANNKFLMTELRRMREFRSELVVEELALAMELQTSFLRSAQGIMVSNFQGTFPPGQTKTNESKRRNKWLQNGFMETRKLVGYCGDRSSAPPMTTVDNRDKSEVGSPPPFTRSQSAVHYVRNAPRGKQLKLGNIGRQFSLSTTNDRNRVKKEQFVLPSDDSDQDEDEDDQAHCSEAKKREEPTTSEIADEEFCQSDENQEDEVSIQTLTSSEEELEDQLNEEDGKTIIRIMNTDSILQSRNRPSLPSSSSNPPSSAA